MAQTKTKLNSWKESFSAFFHPRVITMLFLGFSAGIPLLLIFSSLSLWLREAGIQRSAVTFFSWAALGYSFKFIWAPLVDKLPVPILTRLIGRRRSWLLVAQFAVITAICGMALTDPLGDGNQLTFMALAAVMLGFSSATQDIIIDAYRIESAGKELQAMMASTYIAGYRIAMLVAGAGALYLASYFGSEKGSYNYSAWQWTYLIMALTMLIGVATTLIISEPEISNARQNNYQVRDYVGFLLLFLFAICGFILSFYFSADIAEDLKTVLTDVFANNKLAGFLIEMVRLAVGITVAFVVARLILFTGVVNQSLVRQTYVDPIRDFFERYGVGLAWLLLALVGLYRISDIVLGVIANVFYQDMGFTKPEIATIAKTFGLFMTITGGLAGGIFAIRFGIIRILFLGALLSSTTNLLFMLMSYTGHNVPFLYVVISADNLSGGLANAAFVAFLSSLTDIKFTAVQYAIFSSLMTLIPKITGGYSGTMVDNLGYPMFFLITTVIGIPILILVWLAGKHLSLRELSSST